MRKTNDSSTVQQKHINKQVMLTQNSRIAIPTISNNNLGVAAALSLIVPGSGQMYRGNVNSGLKWFILVLLGYLLFVLPGFLMHVACVYRASHKKFYKN